ASDPHSVPTRRSSDLRFPRLVMGLMVGAALAVAGAVMQAIFGNPLAEPGVVGVSSGAALGASVSIVLGLTVLGSWSTAAFAFAEIGRATSELQSRENL